MGGPLAPGRAALPRLQGLMLKGKVVLVTGAGGGIGRDFALAMAAAGAKVLVNDLWTSANRIVQAALDNFGRIDAVVNNAGILRDRFFFNMSIEEWRAVIDVHLNGTFYVSRAAAPYFKGQNSGR